MLSVDLVAVSAAHPLACEEAGFDRSATIRWTARSVIPMCSATSRRRTSGSCAMRSRTWVWFVTNVQPAGAGRSFDIDDIFIVNFVS